MARKALGRGLNALIPNPSDLLTSTDRRESNAGTAPVHPSEPDAPAPGTPPPQSGPPGAPASGTPPAAAAAPRDASPAEARHGLASGRASAVIEIALDRIAPNPYQPREEFDDQETTELAESIQSKGVLQPLLVRRRGVGYELIAGERRLRAARRAGLSTVPVIVRDAGDEEVLALALIENEQRVDLNPIEAARGYARIIEEFQLSQTELAQVLGRDRSTVSNLLRLLELPEKVQALVRQRRLTMGHARALAGVEGAARCVAVAERAAKQGLSVRAVERLAQAAPRSGGPRPARRGDPELVPFEERLRRRFATQARIHRRGDRGRIEIEFYGSDELERILGELGALEEV